MSTATAPWPFDIIDYGSTSTPHAILLAARRMFGIRRKELCGPGHQKSISYARNVCMCALRRSSEMSFREIGELFGGRDHTTVLKNVRRMEADARDDNLMRSHIEHLANDFERARQTAALAVGEEWRCAKQHSSDQYRKWACDRNRVYAMIQLTEDEYEKMRRDLELSRAYSTYCKVCAISAERPVEFDEFVKKHCQPRTVQP